MSTHFSKIFVGLIVLAMILTGCGGQEATEAPVVDDEIRVGFSGADLLDDFQNQLYQGVADRAEELGVTLIHIENGNDPVKQADDIEDLLAQDLDALLITAANPDAIVASIEQADEMGVPVFTIDSAANSDLVMNHTGNDLYCIGYRSVEFLADYIGGEGKILHINGVPGMAIVTWNTDGVEAYVAEHPDIELVQTAYANWDPAQALAATEDMLLAHPDLAGIYVISEVMTQGPIQALAAQGLTGEIPIMSGGFAPESQQWLENEEIVAAFEWSSYEGGQEQMQRIYDYLTEGIVPPTFSPLVVYAHTKDGEPYQLDCPIGDWTP
jgi:ABC-type sugar transport system substrate-binding protein